MNCLKYEFTRTVDFQINRNHPNKMWQKEMLEFLCWIGDVDCVGAAVKEYLRNEDDLTRYGFKIYDFAPYNNSTVCVNIPESILIYNMLYFARCSAEDPRRN